MRCRGRNATFAVVRDVTAKKEHDRALHDSEERMRRLVDAVKDYAIFMRDRDGVITSWNEGARRLKGYTPKEAIGRHSGASKVTVRVARRGPNIAQFLGGRCELTSRLGAGTGLRAYSRLDRPAGATANARSDEALAEARDRLRAAFEESGARIEAGALPPVRADHAQLVQLFQNLIANAIKFRSAGPPVIRVAAESDGVLCRFRVSDNGIDPQHFKKVFIIFERLHGVEVPGSGVGLALCRKIVQRHGGRIWIEPAAGGGTSLCFTLPAAKGTLP